MDSGNDTGFTARIDPEHPASILCFPVSATYLSCDVLCCGFIANRRDLGERLIRGRASSGVSDAEIFASAFRRWGPQFSAHIFGEYSVVIFDRKTQTLLAANDSLGLRPLYYSLRGRQLAIASHIEHIIFKHRDWEIDERYVATYLANTITDGSRTVYKDVRTLRCGHVLECSSAGVVERETWSLRSVTPVCLRNADEYAEQFRSLLYESVRGARHGKTWGELSGGLDSSSVICAAKNCGVDDLEAVSIVYSRSKTADEREWIREVIEKYQLPWHTLDEDDEQPFSEAPNRFLPEPSHVSLMWRLFRRYETLMRDHGVSVILSGFGGDQVLLGDMVKPVYLADRLLHLQLKRVWRELREWQCAGSQQRSIRHIATESIISPLLRYARGLSLTAEKTVLPTWLHPDFKDRMNLKPSHLVGPSTRMPSVAGQYYFERVWRVSLGSGQYWSHLLRDVHMRYPLLYRPLVEFMYAVPWNRKLRPDEDRALQRSALKGILPSRIQTRRDKKGPDEAFLRGLQSKGEVYALITEDPRIVRRGYVQQDAWKQAIRAASCGYSDSFGSLLSAASLELWLRQFE
jgi:asparagine synthase (glutamine-hydrolysing)